MRKFGYGIALGAILLTSGRAPTQPSVGFYLETRGPAATDIVVTDPDGRVLENWRGELRPGDIVRLGHARLTPANALPWEYVRFRPNRPHPGFYSEQRHESRVVSARPVPVTGDLGYELSHFGLWPTGAEADLRLVLFLRKEATGAGLGVIWLPASARPGGAPAPVEEYVMGSPYWRDRYISASPDDFVSCVAFVEAGRVVALQQMDTRWGRKAMLPFTGTLSDFKKEALRLPAP